MPTSLKCWKKCLVLMLCLLMMAGVASASAKVIRIGDGGWSALDFEIGVVKYIIENGYQYKTEVVPGDEPAMQSALESGKIDIVTEFWMYDQAKHDAAKKAGIILDVHPAFIATDGLWVPAYVVKGDAAKGVKPVAPDLKTMADLKKYAAVFNNTIQLGVEGWTANPDMIDRMKKYDLASVYAYKTLKAEDELSANVVAQINKGEPIVFYDYMPNALLGKYDVIAIDDPIRDQQPPSYVWISASVDLSKNAPDVYAFLARFQLDLPTINKQLANIEDNKLSYDDAAKAFLKANPEFVKYWCADEAAARVNAALNR